MGDLTCSVGDRPQLELWTGVNLTRLAARAPAGAMTITVYDTTGYADGDIVLIAPRGDEIADDRMETRTIAASGVNATTGVITLTVALRFDHQVDAAVWEAKNPTTLALEILNPDGSTTTKAISDFTAVSTGHYTYEQTMSAEGDYVYSWITTGTVIAGSRDYLLHVSDSRNS